MKVVRTVAEFDFDRMSTLALVPTMGAFHDAHLHLMREARKHADRVAVSLFVNPTQFRPGEDFEKYPRNEDRDFELAQEAGVDIMFAPSVEEMYGNAGLADDDSIAPATAEPRERLFAEVLVKADREREGAEESYSDMPEANPMHPLPVGTVGKQDGKSRRIAEGTVIHVSGITDRWEGHFRPGHFDGVATVVAKLFNIIRPDVAIFGLKDFQQCQVIRKMVVDLNFPLHLHFEPTVREPDGLAMSSRNRFLSVEERRIAPLLYMNLCQVAESIRQDPREKIIDLRLATNRAALSALGFAVDYLELVDSVTLDPVRNAKSWNRLIVAAKLGSTRLIDNIGLFEDH